MVTVGIVLVRVGERRVCMGVPVACARGDRLWMLVVVMVVGVGVPVGVFTWFVDVWVRVAFGEM